MLQYRNSNLLYRPSVSIWTARKNDKDESVKVNKGAGAVDGVANVTKQLLPGCVELEAVKTCASAFREWVRSRTLEWDTGWRIGQVAKHMDFMAEAGDQMREFDTLVEAFVDAYALAYSNAQFTLAGMFKAADYPGIAEVRGKFRISLDVMPMPNTDDFRVVDGVPLEEVARLCAVTEEAVNTRVKNAMTEAYDRLFAVVSKLGATLTRFGNKEVNRFNDTLLGNIAELVDAMPALNITGDPRLDALAADARLLLSYDIADLRKDEGTRRAAIKEADALARKFIAGNAKTTVTHATSVAALCADMMEG